MADTARGFFTVVLPPPPEGPDDIYDDLDDSSLNVRWVNWEDVEACLELSNTFKKKMQFEFQFSIQMYLKVN